MPVFHLWEGDCLERLKEIELNSIDSIVTDPPYGLGFMGKKWDIGVPAVDVFAECLRVLKPGGHLLAFGGSRTYHRLAVAVEDAGFEIRDQIMWVYGSGFPKSQNVSKAIDKAVGAKREVVGVSHHAANRKADMGFHGGSEDEGQRTITAPATDAAKQWDGWGTALKPAHEPILVARKPLTGTVAANVLEHGTGAINVDGCRVGDFVNTTPSGMDRYNAANAAQGYRPGEYQKGTPTVDEKTGRWPANLIHDGSDEVLALFPVTTSGTVAEHHKRNTSGGNGLTHGAMAGVTGPARTGSTGSAARFFYSAKASKKDRGEGNSHPTVKPTDLMRYLVRLVTPPGGTVLDPFAGSGSTGKAAMLEGFDAILIEKEAEYLPVSRARLIHAGGTDVAFVEDDWRDELI